MADCNVRFAGLTQGGLGKVALGSSTSGKRQWRFRYLAFAGLVMLLSMIEAPSVHAQSFELSAPNINRTSRANLTDRELRILDQEGRETLYTRYADLDSVDGQYLAYRNGVGGQIIRWPATNSGPMQIGTQTDGQYLFRTSQMQVIGRGPAMTGRPPAASNEFFAQIIAQKQTQPQVMRLCIRDDRGRDWYLGKSGANRLAMHGAANPTVADWYVIPAGRGYVRVGQLNGPQWHALSVVGNRNLAFEPLAQQASQLWRVVQTGFGGYWLESAIAPGFALTGAVSGAVNLLPISGNYGQLWVPQPIGIAPGFEPLWRTVSHEVQPNPPLPPAQIEIVNSHSGALRILIADARNTQLREVRIEPNNRKTVAFDRDAGATVIETYEIRGTSGLWDRQQFVTQIPPSPIYDLSVYEEFLQSIAIDRTGTSPNPIEDVNYQPKSVGWLPLPPGDALPVRGQIDAYQDALAAKNPGAVRRFDPKSLEKPSTQPDPLKTILDNAAPRQRQKF